MSWEPTSPYGAESMLGEAMEHIYDMEEYADQLEAENAKLRELVADMWHEGMCECGSRGRCASCEYDYPTRMHELGVEV